MEFEPNEMNMTGHTDSGIPPEPVGESQLPAPDRRRARAIFSRLGIGVTLVLVLSSAVQLILAAVPCATGTHSIGEAYRAIKHGYADAVIAGGSEAGINPVSIGGFANCKALTKSEDPKYASLPFNKNRAGFVIAEGSGIVLLEEYEHAKQRGAKIYAELCGYGNSCDAYHSTAPRPDGTTQSLAIKQALEEAQFKAGESIYINAHGTGTPMNDSGETKAIKIAMGEEEAHKAHISSTKSEMGHALGAAGAIELVISVMALNNGIVPPTIGLDEPDPECDLDYTPNKPLKVDLDIAISNSLGFGGHNACLAVRKVK